MDRGYLHMVLPQGLWVSPSKVSRRDFERLGWFPSLDVCDGAPCNNMAQEVACYPFADGITALFEGVKE
jgi:hypothetical protein